MTWRIELDDDARKVLRKLDKPTAQRIVKELREVESLADPTDMGKPLSANRAGFWVYRVGDYRLICDVQYGRLVVLVIEVQHRSEDYR